MAVEPSVEMPAASMLGSAAQPQPSETSEAGSPTLAAYAVAASVAVNAFVRTQGKAVAIGLADAI